MVRSRREELRIGPGAYLRHGTSRRKELRIGLEAYIRHGTFPS